jgi:hypothetical protein
MYIRKWLVPLLGALLILVVGCNAEDDLPPQPVLAARDRYAESIDVPSVEVQVVDYEQATWDNSCLELGPIAGVPCEEEETPGWRAVLEANDQQQEVRVNESGTIVRWEGQPVLPVDADLTPQPKVRVSIDPIAGVTIAQELMPYEAELGMFDVTPQHQRITLNDYPLENTEFQAHLRIYEVAALEAVRENVEQLILEHEQVVVAIPDLERGSLPFVPMILAGQVFYAQPKVLSFQGGDGYRFLTEYGGEDIPITDENLFYAYQGLTEDDNYFVTAFLPVTASEEAKASVEALNEAAASSFTPDLGELDAMIESIALQPIETE